VTQAAALMFAAADKALLFRHRHGYEAKPIWRDKDDNENRGLPG